MAADLTPAKFIAEGILHTPVGDRKAFLLEVLENAAAGLKVILGAEAAADLLDTAAAEMREIANGR